MLPHIQKLATDFTDYTDFFLKYFRSLKEWVAPSFVASDLIPPRQNSKSEARNPKQCQMSQIENSKRASLQAVRFRDLEIRILNLFRISKFELRISKGKLEHSVNFVV